MKSYTLPSRIISGSFCWASLCLAVPAVANEIHSNGTGGGRWSEPSTWRGNAVPGAEDDAIVASRDSVLFDRDDADKTTCKTLILDPNSNFAFQSGLGKRTLTVNGPIELYGSFKMHAATMTDEMTVRLISPVDAERAIKLVRGGALLVLGRSDLAAGHQNAILTVGAVPERKLPLAGVLTAGAGTMIDLQHARIHQLAVSASNIDNTGAKPNERCNFYGNEFTGESTLAVAVCDTPVIVKNEFDAPKSGMVRPGAITVSSSPLADVRGNHIKGPYAIGISMNVSEGSVTGNTVENCPQGIVWHTGPAMLKQNTIRNCKIGLSLRTIVGSAEDTNIEGGDLPISTASAKAQLSNVVITNPPKDILMESTASSIGLLNCNIRPEQIKSVREANLPRDVSHEDPQIETMAFLVVGLKGTLPDHAHVQLLTSHPEKPLPPGALDMNVRNSPAPVRPDGLTPLPQSLTPLIVKSWSVDDAGKMTPAPEYTLNVIAAATEPGGKPQVLKTLSLKVDETWFRPAPNDPKPTLEIPLP